jgi:hypothetical protein
MSKTPASLTPSGVGHQYKSRDARDRFPSLLDEAARGGIPVVRRDREAEPFVVARRDVFDRALAASAPFVVKASVADGQVSLWLEDIPVLASAPTLDEAEEEFLDALIDYADLWLSDLRNAPNHRASAPYVQRIAAWAGDRDEFRQLVFGD